MGSCSTNFVAFAAHFARSGNGWGSSRATQTRRVAPALARVGGLVVVALLLIAILPSTAHAWTPGTHVYLGEAVLRSLWQLPAPIADLLRAFPYNFLYGSIAADTSMAKKYVPTGRHCHSWLVGLEIHDAAPDEPMRAFALGYLAHLAADAIAHNYFVPKQLAITASTSSLGHTYWESRFETHLGSSCARQARDLIMLDHSQADGLLDRILSPTIFSTQTNRRIFRGMVHAADNEGWQRIFGLMTENSRWDLADAEVERYLDHAYDHVIDLLVRFDHSTPYQLDPSGDDALRRSKQVRKEALRVGGMERMHEEAERHFGLPVASLGYVGKLTPPVYRASRAASI
ncbi:MAG: zinc dependent phospholipase C family protein [bacterium]